MTATDDRTEAGGAQGVSAVVLCYNAERHIGTCVRSLAETLAPFPGSEVLVVENGSDDTSPAILRELERAYPDLLEVIWLDTNMGTTRSRNLAFDRARNPWLLVIDADASIDKDSLRRLMEVFHEEPDCAIAVPRIEYPDGRFQLSCDRFPTLWRKLQRAFGLKDMEASMTPPDKRLDVDCAISALWLMRRSLLRTVGKFDERIFYAPEDVDYCYRVWQAGLRVICEPEAVATHDARELSRGLRINLFTLHHLAGLAYYFRKHGYLLKAPRPQRSSTPSC